MKHYLIALLAVTAIGVAGCGGGAESASERNTSRQEYARNGNCEAQADASADGKLPQSELSKCQEEETADKNEAASNKEHAQENEQEREGHRLKEEGK
jgi:hypothetical protein